MKHWLFDEDRFSYEWAVAGGTLLLSVLAIIWAYRAGVIIAYGDAESHLNIAKRVIDSLTPGAAQLGGIWLPLPHILMIPFVSIDWLWRTGLAGSIVSAVAYIAASVYLFKIGRFISNKAWVGLMATSVFALNPNILYFQATPMTELLLIAFFIISSFYFIKFAFDPNDVPALVLAAFFGFAASITRYDGWFLVLAEAAGVVWVHLGKKIQWTEMEGRLVLFSCLAFLGIGLWLLWDWLILGNPLYFSASEYSAKSQQNSWLLRGELPSYHHLGSAISYYAVTAAVNIGFVLTGLAVIGIILYIFSRPKRGLIVLGLMAVPFVFYVVTLYFGQSVIFIPNLTPATYDYQLFNARYGLMMVPAAALFFGLLLWRLPRWARLIPILLLVVQLGSFFVGYEPVITLADGTHGLSRATPGDAQQWIAKNYDSGMVLLDDYARTLSIIRSPIPMRNVIYVGNKPYWQQSLVAPERYATWIIMQKDDTLWNAFINNPKMRDRLYKYFHKTYTSTNVLIFKRSS